MSALVGTTLRSPASTAGLSESTNARACALKRSLEPIEQPPKPAVDAVNVIGRDLQHHARSLETTSDRIDAEISKVRAFRFDGRREAGHTRVAVLLPHAINSSREMQVAKRKKAKKGKKK